MEDPGTIFSPLSFCIRVMLETVFDGWDSMSSSQREDPEGGATLSILWFIWAREECREPFTIGRDHWLICGRILFSRNSLAFSHPKVPDSSAVTLNFFTGKDQYASHIGE